MKIQLHLLKSPEMWEAEGYSNMKKQIFDQDVVSFESFMIDHKLFKTRYKSFNAEVLSSKDFRSYCRRQISYWR